MEKDFKNKHTHSQIEIWDIICPSGINIQAEEDLQHSGMCCRQYAWVQLQKEVEPISGTQFLVHNQKLNAPSSKEGKHNSETVWNSCRLPGNSHSAPSLQQPVCGR